jgi:branched-chain amino acid transport system permease protein
MHRSGAPTGTLADRVGPRPLQAGALAVIAIVACVYPLLAGSYYTYLGGLTLTAVIGAVAMNLLTGYTGLISFGAAAFLAVGGYAVAIIATVWGLSFWLALPVAVIAAALVGLVVGVPSLRLRGLYMVLTTLALHYIVIYLADRYQRHEGKIGGFTISPPSFLGHRLGSPTDRYYLSLALAALAVLYCAHLLRTRVGRAFIAVRDRDSAAAILGINVSAYKLAAFVVSSALLGLCGALQALNAGNVTVENYDLLVAVNFIAMFIIGGTASLRGSVIGAAFVTLLPVAVRNLLGHVPAGTPLFSRLDAHVFDVNAVIFGLLIILFVRLEPAGLIGLWDRLVRSVGSRGSAGGPRRSVAVQVES